MKSLIQLIIDFELILNQLNRLFESFFLINSKLMIIIIKIYLYNLNRDPIQI